MNPFSNNFHSNIYPSTSISMHQMLERYKVNVEEKKVVILGKSYLVGIPAKKLFEGKRGNVTILDKHDMHIKEQIKEADILVSCTGSPINLKKKDVKDGLVLFDVGIIYNESTKTIRGDVDKSDIINKLSLYTPVPGGIGPLTVSNMMNNLYQTYLFHEEIRDF